MSEQIRLVGTNTEGQIQQIEATTERHLRHLTEQFSQFTEHHWERTEHLTEQIGQLTETASRSLSGIISRLEESRQEDIAGQVVSLMATLEAFV